MPVFPPRIVINHQAAPRNLSYRRHVLSHQCHSVPRSVLLLRSALITLAMSSSRTVLALEVMRLDCRQLAAGRRDDEEPLS
jgi:hypothetical protein